MVLVLRAGGLARCLIGIDVSVGGNWCRVLSGMEDFFFVRINSSHASAELTSLRPGILQVELVNQGFVKYMSSTKTARPVALEDNKAMKLSASPTTQNNA
jgi:hypothetical protein